MESEEIISSFKTMIEDLQNSQKELSDKLDSILKEASDASRSYDKEKFSERNKDFFDKYGSKVKAIEGDDFDFEETAFSSIPEGMEEAEYIAKLSAKLDEQLQKLKEALGTDAVTVTSDEDSTEVTPEIEPSESTEAEPEEEEDELAELEKEVDKEKARR